MNVEFYETVYLLPGWPPPNPIIMFIAPIPIPSIPGGIPIGPPPPPPDRAVGLTMKLFLVRLTRSNKARELV